MRRTANAGHDGGERCTLPRPVPWRCVVVKPGPAEQRPERLAAQRRQLMAVDLRMVDCSINTSSRRAYHLALLANTRALLLARWRPRRA